jgi:hypothetical protein
MLARPSQKLQTGNGYRAKDRLREKPRPLAPIFAHGRAIQIAKALEPKGRRPFLYHAAVRPPVPY